MTAWVGAHKNPRHEIIIWDWKEQPYWGRINMIIEEMEMPYISPVKTEDDSNAIIISDGIITPEQAQEYYNQWDH